MSFICAGIVAVFVSNGVAFWLSQRYDNEVFFSEHGYNHPVHAVASRFILDNESSLPTWVSSGLLFFAAMLLAMIALDSVHRHDRLKWFWWGLAIVFLCFLHSAPLPRRPRITMFLVRLFGLLVVPQHRVPSIR